MELHSVRQCLRVTFKKWCPVFVLAFVLTLAVHVLFLSERGICSAVVHFNYAGIESGYDPNGNRFDAAEMKNAVLIRQAAAAIGEDVAEEDVERIQNALEIVGEISDTVFQKIAEKTSIFGEDGLSEVTDIKEATYFPSHYTLKLHYADAGFTAQNATRYLAELLKAYEPYFYEKYGYHTSFKNSLSEANSQTYDYIDFVDILSNHLSTLRDYLAYMESQNNVRFVSRETGYSFTDLIGAIDTIRNEDVQWVTSYIISNNMTTDRTKLMDYYRYKIEDAKRALAQQNSRLDTLNAQIESYVKTNAVFPILGDNTGSRENVEPSNFEFSQPSQMYNDLISQKVSCQTSISETQEQISMLNRRVERLEAAESSGNVELLEAQLKAIDDKIQQILSDIQRTSDEFYKSEYLKNAFQTLKEPKTHMLSFSLKSTALDIVTVEAFLFGLWILVSAFYGTRTDKRRETEKEQVSK
ncbi:MAG: hypothetical protein IJR72_01215 [Oscillospiraceae bacterium]|nr:hypothetical protein [Oscillospiraceae bacterium]